MSPFCKPKPKVVRLFLGISPRDLGNEHGAKEGGIGVSASTDASTVGNVSMEAPQGTENVNPQVVMVTGKPASAKSNARVRMTNKRLLVVLATLNVNPNLVKKFFTYGQKMKTCSELHALLLAQARIVEKDKDSCDQDNCVC